MKNVNFGTGSGAINITGMAQLGLLPGDTLTIVPGIYSGGSISNLSNISVLTYEKVSFTGTINISGLSGVSWDMYIGNTNHQDNFLVQSHCESLTFKKGARTSCGLFMNAGSNGLTPKYDGNKSTTALSDVSISYFVDNISAGLTQGYWGEYVQDLLNVIDGLEIKYCISNLPTATEIVRGAGVYRHDIHDNKFYDDDQTGYKTGDTAKFLISGNGKFYNNYRSGGWGWLYRNFGTSLGTTVLDTLIYNNIDLNTTCYGTIEVRNDPKYRAAGVTGTNIKVYNNTNGNKKDPASYTTAVVLIPNNQLPFTVDIRNNISYNSPSSNNGHGGTNGILVWNPTGVTQSNNKYYTDWKAAGFTDNVNAQVANGSPLLGAGVKTFVTSDYNGNTRPNPPSIGATELIALPNKVPIANAGPNQITTLPSSSAVLDGSASFDPDGNIVTWLWKQLSGPNQSVIANGNTSKANVSGLIAGVYSFNLSVTDNAGAVSNSPVAVTVNPAPKKITKTVTTVDYIAGTQSQAVFYSDGTNIVTTIP